MPKASPIRVTQTEQLATNQMQEEEGSEAEEVHTELTQVSIHRLMNQQ